MLTSRAFSILVSWLGLTPITRKSMYFRGNVHLIASRVSLMLVLLSFASSLSLIFNYGNALNYCALFQCRRHILWFEWKDFYLRVRWNYFGLRCNRYYYLWNLTTVTCPSLRPLLLMFCVEPLFPWICRINRAKFHQFRTKSLYWSLPNRNNSNISYGQI